MNTSPDPQLSSELQELYLQNKQWLSDVLFLEDETRVFKKMLDRFFSISIKNNRFDQLQHISPSLQKLENRHAHLKQAAIDHSV